MPNAPTLPTADQVRDWLQGVKDPEIPTISLVDLGVVDQVTIQPDGNVAVTLIPTFAGCPAIELMRLEAEAALREAGVQEPTVVIDRNRAWSSDRITPQGRVALKKHGLSPPPSADLPLEEWPAAECPNCGSVQTELKNPFGPTLCRAIHHCSSCGETFEQFKPL